VAGAPRRPKPKPKRRAGAGAGGARFRLSRHISFFRRGDEIYLYHDLWGFLLQMDRRVHDFIRRFEGGATVAEAARPFRGQLRPEEIEGFVGTLKSHRCIVAPRADEEALALAGYPVRAPWIVWYGPSREDETILAVKDRALGRVVLEPLSGVASRFFRAATGEHSVAEIVAKLAGDGAGGVAGDADIEGDVRHILFRLTHSDRQVMKLAERPLYTYLQFPPPYLRSTVPFPRLEDADGDGARGDVVDLAAYHREHIEDAAQQFDVEETTLSHMFREPHPALRGRTYGAAFADALLGRGLIAGEGAGRGRLQVAEVGGGVGFFGLGFLRHLESTAPALAARAAYTIVDLSQVLQDSQRMLNSSLAPERVRYVLADASRSLPFADASIDLLISNEVIADLETVRLRRADIESDTPPDSAPEPVERAQELVRRHALPIDDAPEVFWLNAGALRLVEELGRVLVPGGAAVLVEFGEADRYPVESTHLDHSEFSIHFGHVRHVAERVGLEVELTDVIKLLGLDPKVRVLATTRSSFEALRALLDRRGVRLQKLAYTQDAFRALLGDRLDPEALHEISFRPAGERALGLMPREFKVAILRKPAAAVSS
jgi:SAM-dependent methyltransferase